MAELYAYDGIPGGVKEMCDSPEKLSGCFGCGDSEQPGVKGTRMQKPWKLKVLSSDLITNGLWTMSESRGSSKLNA